MITLTAIIITITAVVSILGFRSEEQLGKLLFAPYYMEEPRQWYRFITHGFVHADWSHLIFNMMSLYFAGEIAEDVILQVKGPELGRVWFITLYILGILVSSIPSYIRNRNNPDYRSLGASGAVSSVIFFFIMFFPLAKINIMFIPIGIPAWIFGILYLVYEYYMDKRQYGRIAHDAHFFGALFGIVFAIVIYPKVIIEFIFQVKGALGA
ncbi:MAG: rhomboid family intramembrane serine protease [Bacteroidota bacterium]